MKAVRRATLPAVGLVALLIGIVLATAGPAVAKQLQEVLVVNGTDRPVPVAAQGTTKIAGTVGIDPAANMVVSKDGTAFTTYFQTRTTDQLGQIFLTGILDARGFDKVSVEIVQFPTTVGGLTVTVDEGKISGTTLSQFIDSFPLSTTALIHTYDVNGPDFSLILTGGPPNTAVGIQAWVYFH
jgi:hypothetical protein